MAKTRSRRVPATTNNITTGIVNFLNSKGHCAFRVNTAGIWDRVAGTYRRMPAASLGCPDVIACMKDQRHLTLIGESKARGIEAIPASSLLPGYFMGFEIKNEATKDTMKEDQRRFHERVSNAGGLVITVKNYSDFFDWYSSSAFNVTILK